MLGRDTRLLRHLWFVAVLGGCSPGTLINAPTCTGAGCTCEEDPSQPTCKAFNERPEGGTELPVEGGSESSTDAGDGSADADEAG
jgi:hypothetical protein